MGIDTLDSISARDRAAPQLPAAEAGADEATEHDVLLYSDDVDTRER